MKILLVQPCRRRQFYKNPFKLQAVYAETFSYLPEAEFILWDRDTSEDLPPCQVCEILVLDASDGDVKAIRDVIGMVETKHVFLIDAPYAVRISAFSELHSSVQVVSLTEVADLLVDKSCEKMTKKFKELRTPPLLFPPAVQTEFLSRGIQFFIEGVARGCEGQCSFCHLPIKKEPISVVPYDTTSIILQANKLLNIPLFVQFTDENFFGCHSNRQKYILALARTLQQNGFHGYIGVDTRLDSLPIFNHNDALCWEEMERIGLRYCFLGIESFAYSQAKRYGKPILHRHIEQALNFMAVKNIAFTLGLIMWDPLMTVSELEENINFIENTGLIGKTASFLKPLRLHPDGLYMHLFGNTLSPNTPLASSVAYWDRCASIYQDEKIRHMARLLFPVYGRFSNAGYRHSDVSLFEAFSEVAQSSVYRGIPARVSNLEMDCIRKLLPMSCAELAHLTPDLFISDCIRTAREILKDLNTVDNRHPTIHNYYLKVFTDIQNEP